MLDLVLAYVEDVLAGRAPPDNAVGRALFDMVHAVPTITPDQFDEMFNSNIKVWFFYFVCKHYPKMIYKKNIELMRHSVFILLLKPLYIYNIVKEMHKRM